MVIFFRYYLDKNVIDSLLTVAQYTYGPLLGLFAFGIFTDYKIDDDKVFLVVIINIILIILIGNIPPEAIGGYSIGYELLPFNGLINFIGLYLITKLRQFGILIDWYFFCRCYVKKLLCLKEKSMFQLKTFSR